MALVEAVHDDNTYRYPAREAEGGADSGGVLFNKHQLIRRHCAVKVHEQGELTRTLSRIVVILSTRLRAPPLPAHPPPDGRLPYPLRVVGDAARPRTSACRVSETATKTSSDAALVASRMAVCFTATANLGIKPRDSSIIIRVPSMNVHMRARGERPLWNGKLYIDANCGKVYAAL